MYVQGAEKHPEVPSHDVTADWADLSAIPDVKSSWAHSGVVVTSGGELVGFHAGQLVAFDKDGHVLRVLSQGLTEGHGITLVRDGEDEYLWISDPGFVFTYTADIEDDAMAPMFGKGIRHDGSNPRVVKMTLAGRTANPIDRSHLCARPDGTVLSLRYRRGRRAVRWQRGHMGCRRIRKQLGSSL